MRHEPTYCVFCPREVVGSLEVFTGSRWKPVCTACYRARRGDVARTLDEIREEGKLAFRMFPARPRRGSDVGTDDTEAYLVL
jgi:hypothetical protein